MDPTQQAMYIFAQAVSALIEMEGMRAANLEANLQGKSLVYGLQDFQAVPPRFGITHNQVIGFFTGRS